MLKNQSNTAVLIFIRSEQEEARVKNFGSQLPKNARLKIAHLLNRQVKKVAAQAGVPVLVVTSAMQSGQTFGERFAGAIERAFNLGFENVISIGNDCLSLTPAMLRQAIAGLQVQDFVFGPSEDGGVYLLGLNVRQFRLQAFTHLPWQTENLFAALISYGQNDNISLLPTATDADDEVSLAAALRSMKCSLSLKKSIENILQPFSRIFVFLKKCLPNNFKAYHFSLRAPPC